ncbi:hypothetical protein WN48_04517 [Eufriesea mexicana]|nr:hypothetical protein WN48_04517 [Eufriesea mexicana]
MFILLGLMVLGINSVIEVFFNAQVFSSNVWLVIYGSIIKTLSVCVRTGNEYYSIHCLFSLFTSHTAYGQSGGTQRHEKSV